MPKKLTQEEAEERVLKRCQEMNYTLLEPFIYIGGNMKIKLKCNKDNYEWNPTITNFIKNRNCPMCGGVAKTDKGIALKYIMDKCLNMNYTILNNIFFIGNRTKIELKCNIDNYEWTTSYYNFIKRNQKCPMCGGKLLISIDEINKYINDICILKNIILQEDFTYIGGKTRIKLKCNKDGYEWETSINSLKLNSGCPKCAKNILIQQSEAEEIINQYCKRNKYLLQYKFTFIGNNTRIYLKCENNNHIHVWNTSYGTLINSNSGCPKCGGKLRYTQYEAEICVKNRCDSICYQLIKPFVYTNSNTILNLKCNKEHIIEMSFRKLVINKSLCKKCNSSNGELIIYKIFELYNVSYIEQYRFKDCKDKKSLPFDFYLSDINTCIEFDGIQHFNIIERFGGQNEYNNRQRRDKIKTDYCSNNNIKLIRIRYDENIEEILKNNGIIP